MGGGILISQDSDNVVTISYQSTNHGSLRVLLWGKDLFACINGISLALRGDEFSASVKIELGKLGKQGKGAVAKATVQELTRYICHFVVKCEKVLDQIHDSYVEDMHYQQLYLETYGGAENSANALIGYDAGCVVVDESWLAQAEAATLGV